MFLTHLVTPTEAVYNTIWLNPQKVMSIEPYNKPGFVLITMEPMKWVICSPYRVEELSDKAFMASLSPNDAFNEVLEQLLSKRMQY